VKRRASPAGCGLAAVLATTLAGAQPAGGLHLADAERFAALLAAPTLPDAARLQAAYLDPASAGVRLFTPRRIRDAPTLAKALAADPAAYRHAARLCLPVARGLQAEAAAVAARVGELLGATQPAPAWVVFGAGNSGGTASAEGLVLGLEVICREAADEAAAAQILRDFIAHELVHVHQARAGTEESNGDLLRQALVEGFADHVMMRATGGSAVADRERDRHGRAHEAALWREFKAAVDAGRGLGGWLYGPSGVPGRPPDMGYWIGRRICDAYVARADDAAQALRTLLALRDPVAILRDSGYGRDLGR
jgi:Predicted Zn-dependent protease (DUF2268)